MELRKVVLSTKSKTDSLATQVDMYVHVYVYSIYMYILLLVHVA